MKAPIGIPCAEDRCLHLDAKAGRCNLRPPIAPGDSTWIFALPGCGIAAAYQDFLGLPSRLEARDRHLDDAALEGLPLLESLALLLAGEDGGARWPAAPARTRLEECRREREAIARALPPPRRGWVERIGGPPAAAGLLLLFALLLLFIAGFFRADEEMAGHAVPRGLVSATLRVAADTDQADDFRVELVLDAPRFVSIWSVPEEGPVLRLFPPPSAPDGLPWPLTPTDARGVTIPAAPAVLVAGSQRLIIVVAAAEDDAPDPFAGLDQVEREPAAIRAALPHCKVLSWSEPRQ